MKSSNLDKGTIDRVVAALLEVDEDSAPHSSSFRFVDAFVIPKFRHDPIKKIFHE